MDDNVRAGYFITPNFRKAHNTVLSRGLALNIAIGSMQGYFDTGKIGSARRQIHLNLDGDPIGHIGIIEHQHLYLCILIWLYGYVISC